MTYIQLSYGDLVLPALLVVMDGALSLALRLKLEKQLAIATVRMVLQLVLVGYVLTFLFAAVSPLWTALAAVVMVLFASREIVARQKRRLPGRVRLGSLLRDQPDARAADQSHHLHQHWRLARRRAHRRCRRRGGGADHRAVRGRAQRHRACLQQLRERAVPRRRRVVGAQGRDGDRRSRPRKVAPGSLERIAGCEKR